MRPGIPVSYQSMIVNTVCSTVLSENKSSEIITIHVLAFHLNTQSFYENVARGSVLSKLSSLPKSSLIKLARWLEFVCPRGQVINSGLVTRVDLHNCLSRRLLGRGKRRKRLMLCRT